MKYLNFLVCMIDEELKILIILVIRLKEANVLRCLKGAWVS